MGAVLVLALALRIVLVVRGGQMFWPDEDRYDFSRFAARHLLAGHGRAAADDLFQSPDHLLFKVAGVLPALVEVATAAPPWVPGLFFAAVSTWVLLLIARAARAAGGDDREALVALILAAAATSLFYYARHFFPYDLSLGLLLLALLRGLRPAPGGRDALWAGAWAGLGFLTYNGYWTLAAVGLVVPVLRAGPGLRTRLARAALAGAGFLLPLALVLAIGAALGHNLLARSVEFAGTVNQGDLGDARHFLVACLWHTEHGLAALWALAAVAGVVLAAGRREPRLLIWPGIALALCALLIVPSDCFQRFAISARHIRVVAPFFSLATAAVLCRLAPGGGRRLLIGAGLALVAGQAAWNFAAPLAQVFPLEFEAMAEKRIARERRHDLGPYRIVNAFFLHNPELVSATPDRGTLLLRRPHPFAFLPYLYEGYSTVLRSRYLQRDLTMRLVRLAVGGPPFHGYPAGTLALTLRFPEEPFGLLPEPLVGTGTHEAGDLVFMEFVGPDHIRLGYDHPSAGAIYAPVLPLDRRQPHRVQIGMGSFFPAGSALSSRLFVKWDDTVALLGDAGFSPTTPDRIDIGHNFIRSSAAVTQLSAEIIGLERQPAPGPALMAAGLPGYFRLQLQLADRAGPYAEPLVLSGTPPQFDLLYLVSDGGGRYRIGYDHLGGGAQLSDSIALDRATPVDLVVGLASLMPPASRALARHELFVSCNGRVLFDRRAEFHPTRPEDVRFGENPAGMTSAAGRLSAQILQVEKLPLGPFPVEFIPYPGVVRLKFRPLGPVGPGRAEPLVCSGLPGAADLVFVRYDAGGRARFGYDHWGWHGLLSAPVAPAADGTFEVTIAMSALFPPADDARFQRHPEWAPFKDRILVKAGDQVLLNEPVPSNLADAATRKFGRNPVGASTCSAELQAEILELAQVRPEEILPLLGPP